MNTYYLTTVVLVVLFSVSANATIRGTRSLEIDFTDEADARTKATWSEQDRLTITSHGLGWDGDGAEVREGWIRSNPVAVGYSWRPPHRVSLRVTIRPKPEEIVLNSGQTRTPYGGDVFARYSPDGKHWSTWQVLSHSEPWSAAGRENPARHFRGTLLVSREEREPYQELLRKYAELDVPWKSDEEAAVRWILEGDPGFFSRRLPFIGYVELRFEGSFHGGQRIMSLKVEVSYAMSGFHHPPENNDIYRERGSEPWSFKAEREESAFHSDGPVKHFHVMKLGIGYDEPIHDLDQWVADNFADGPDGEVDYWRPERFELDINHDGAPEVFVTSMRMHGTGGGPHLVFQKRENSYHYMGQLPGRRHSMRVLPLDDEGSPRVMTFTNAGGGRGIAMVWKWDGQGFALVSEEVIAAGDSGTEEGRKRMEELFGLGGAESHQSDALSAPNAPIAFPDARHWAEPRLFHKEFDDAFADRIRINKGPDKQPGVDANFSPNGSYWFQVEPVSEDTGVDLILVSNDYGSYTIHLKDTYRNYRTRAYWINEKLVFIRVFWGRITGTELIFDVERGAFVFKEMVMDGTILYQQTQEAKEEAQLVDPRSRAVDLDATEREAVEIETSDSHSAEEIRDFQEARFGVSAEMVERLIRRPSEGDRFQEPYATEEEDVSGRLREFFSRATGVNFETPGSSLDYDGFTISVVHTPRDVERIRNVFRRFSPDLRSVPIGPGPNIPVRVRITGHVWKPGRIEYYYLVPSLARVLEDAGGLTRLAGRVFILRSAGDELELIHFSYLDVQKPEVTELLLQDCDWIHVAHPHLEPWPKEWPRRSTTHPSGLDPADRSRLLESWCESRR